jgi:hypothetical protein
MGRKRLRHEPHLYQRLDSFFTKRIEDPVNDAPIVNWLSIRILGVGIGRTPFQRRRSIPRGQQVVNANVNRRRTQVVQLP